MMINREDQDRVRQLLTDAITVLCKNGLNYHSQFCIEGLLGITLDEQEVFLVKIDETVKGRGGADVNDGTPSVEKVSVAVPQRMAVTSPRVRGRIRGGRTFSATRGRISALTSRKRNFYSTPMRETHHANIPGALSAMQDVSETEPPNKLRLQGDVTPRTTPANDNEHVIEIADEEDSNEDQKITQGRSDTSGTHVKQEPPDFTNTSMPADSTQGPDSKYTLDGETSKSLTDFLDNLMTTHATAGSSNTSQSAESSSPAAAGSSALSQLAQMASPKTEPMSSWDQEQPSAMQYPPSSSAMASSSMSPPAQMSIYGMQQNYLKSEFAVLALKPDHEMLVDNTCPVCCKKFETKTVLQHHYAHAHKQNTSFTCKKCHKNFANSHKLKRHQNEVHLGIYPHTCQVCGKGFSNKSEMTAHLVNHGAEPPFRCEYCSKAFRHKKYWQTHLLKAHNIIE